MAPAYPVAASRSRLRRRWRLGPAPITMAVAPWPSGGRGSSRSECSIRGRLGAAVSAPTAATRSNVASASWLAIRRPRSVIAVAVARPQETLLADEADRSAEPRERLLLELVGAVAGGLGRLLDLRVELVVALQVVRHRAS